MTIKQGAQLTTYSYDPNGNHNVTNNDSALGTFTGDADNRVLTSVDPYNGLLTATYDGVGRRSKLVTPATTIEFVRDQQNLLLEANSAGATQADYTNYPGQWGGLTSQRRTGQSTFYGFDQSSNTRMLTGSTGVVCATYLTDTFGMELSSAGSVTNYMQLGGQYDYWRVFQQLLFPGARVLDAAAGQWASRDPEGFDGGDWNLYRFVGDNPVN